jgi:hypothetical protein
MAVSADQYCSVVSRKRVAATAGYGGRVADTQADEDMRAILENELVLLAPDASLEELETLLHPDFTEVLRDGRRFARAEIITLLTTIVRDQTPRAAVEVQGDWISDSAILVTYVSEEGAERLSRVTLWVRSGSGWRAYFHQATPIRAGSGS